MLLGKLWVVKSQTSSLSFFFSYFKTTTAAATTSILNYSAIICISRAKNYNINSTCVAKNWIKRLQNEHSKIY